MLTNEQRATLKTALLADQAEAVEAGDYQALAAYLNAPVAARVLVPTWQVKLHAIQNGYYPGIVLFSRSLPALDNAQAVDVYGVCVSAYEYLNSFEMIDMDLPSVGAMLDGLIIATLITSEVKAALLAMADGTVSRATSLCGAPVSVDLFSIGAILRE